MRLLLDEQERAIRYVEELARGAEGETLLHLLTLLRQLERAQGYAENLDWLRQIKPQ